MIFKQIKEYPSYYINNHGDIFRIINGIARFLKPTIDKKGYAYISISNGSIIKKEKVHRLVAKTFIKNINNKPQINHKDGNKKNNYYKNLEWVTASENIIHSRKILGIGVGEKHGRSKITECNVKTIRMLLNCGIKVKTIKYDYFPSISESAIYHIKNGKNWRNI